MKHLSIKITTQKVLIQYQNKKIRVEHFRSKNATKIFHVKKF